MQKTDVFEKYNAIVNRTLAQSNFKEKEPKELYEPIDYILNLGGKILRPVIVLMGTDVFGGDLELAAKPALAVELFHNFSLMHDDIMDSAPLRRGKTTVHLQYNLNTAILSGDALLIKSLQYLEDLPVELYKPISQLFNQTAIELCEGQQYDMNFENQKEVLFKEYIKMITLKTGVLMGASLKIGALIANATQDQADHIYEFGKNIGIAFQLKDDFLDVFGNLEQIGKKHAGDIFENKKTILYISALENADEDQKKELAFWYGMKTENIDKVYAVEKIFRQLEVDKTVQSLIRHYTEKAFSHFDAMNLDNSQSFPLKELSEHLISRLY